MKRVSHSLLMYGFFALILFGFFACGTAGPELELTAHMDKIVSILKENRADAAQAAASLKQYIADNLADIKNLAKTLATKSSTQADESGVDIDMIFKHTQIIENIIQLEQEEPVLMNDSRIEQALKPLYEVF